LKSALNAVGTPTIADPGVTGGGAKSAIQVFADKVVTKAVAAVQSARIQLLLRELNARGDRINTDLSTIGAGKISDKQYDMPVAALEPLVVTLNAVRAVNPASVADSLVQSHDGLVKAVNDPKTQYGSMMNSIVDFADKAEAVEKAFGSKPTAAAPVSASKSK
jgi:hypothetical protein